MTATLTADELITTALQRIDLVALHIGLSTSISEDEQHEAIADLGAAYVALITHQRLFAEEVAADAG